LKQKPECKIICNQNDDDFDSVFTITDEVAKCLIRAKRDYSAKNYLNEVSGLEECVEEVLKLSLDYVNLIFVYECGGGIDYENLKLD